jgi:acyl carrier protein
MISPAQVIQLLQDHALLIADEALEPESDLFAQGMDSVALMQLLLLVEAELQVSVPPSAITRQRFATPAAIAACLTELPPSAATS